MSKKKKTQENGQKIWQALHDAGFKDVRIEKYADHYKVNIPCSEDDLQTE